MLFNKKNIAIYCLVSVLLMLFLGIAVFKLAEKSNEAAKKASQKATSSPEKIITFVTLNSPSTYYVNNQNTYAGLEYDLAKLFIKELGEEFKIKFLVVNSIESAITAITSKKADILAADLTVTESRKALIDFSIPYEQVQQVVIYNTDETEDPAKSLGDTNGALVVPAATSFTERLTELKKTVPLLSWEERKATHSEKLLEDLAYGEIKYTVADDHLVSILQNYYPNLGIAFKLGKPEKIAWGFAKNGNPALLKKVNLFFEKIKKDGTLRNLIDRYHGNTKRLKAIDVKAFLSKSRTLLPKYKRLFQQAQEITGIDWRLLAAVSYRESHWDTFNTSPTGVRGLMMLTEDTADQMGVTDRLDPKQSIPAGAKYISMLINNLPDRIAEPDRTYLALAAYNIGVAHLEDARVLAERLKLNPDRWVDVKKTLLLLRDPEYYVNAKFGYASGGAPVIFVESIRSYYNILSRFEPEYQPNIDDTYKIASNFPGLLSYKPL